MSDSEGDAFQSADEGETGTGPVENVPSPDQKKEPAAATAKTTTAPQGKKKDRKRGKQRANKKGGKSPRDTDAPPEVKQDKQEPEEEKEEIVEAVTKEEQKEDIKEVTEKVEDPKVEEVTEKVQDLKVEEKVKDEEVKRSTETDLKDESSDSNTKVPDSKDTPVQDDIPQENAEPEKPEAKLMDNATGDAAESTETVKETTETKEAEKSQAEEPKPGARDVSHAFDRLTEPEGGGGGWGSWGGGWGSSILSTATSSVGHLTSSIGEGMKTVVESVEHAVGVPDPEELARIQYERRKEREAEREAERQQQEEVVEQAIDHGTPQQEGELKEADAENTKEGEKPAAQSSSGSWLSGWGVSQLSSVVHKTAEVVNKVGDRGIDVLESIGKKTYEVVAEGEHGVKNLQGSASKTNLSMLLREAAEEADDQAKQEEQFVEARKSHFGAQFDDNQGLVQLEALEMLANECESQVHNLLAGLSPMTLPLAKSHLIAIKDAFDIEEVEDDDATEEQDFEGLMKETTGELGLKVTPDRLVAVKRQAEEWITTKGSDNPSAAEIHQEAIQVLAHLTAAAVGHFHRVGQLCLADDTSTASIYKGRAVSLANTTKYLGVEISVLSGKFTNCLSTSASDKDSTETVNPLMTSIYLEATNSTSYMQDAFQLLLPVLQQAAIQAHKEQHSQG